MRKTIVLLIYENKNDFFSYSEEHPRIANIKVLISPMPLLSKNNFAKIRPIYNAMTRRVDVDYL
ncbi:hypothetical protein PUR_24810 [Paenibacillus sp. URB8-2]|nr:hypothetical protein PUR_24810 [Paenibacillus sp. URB8-2]